jgi:hypothetical protein
MMPIILAQCLQQHLHILGDRRSHSQRYTGDRMNEFQDLGMQRLPLEPAQHRR